MENEDRIKRPYHKKSDRWNIGTPQENTAQVAETPVIEKREISATREITYKDLPESTIKGIEASIESRRILNLVDDSEDRKRKAIDYYKWQLSLRIGDK